MQQWHARSPPRLNHSTSILCTAWLDVQPAGSFVYVQTRCYDVQFNAWSKPINSVSFSEFLLNLLSLNFYMYLVTVVLTRSSYFIFLSNSRTFTYPYCCYSILVFLISSHVCTKLLILFTIQLLVFALLCASLIEKGLGYINRTKMFACFPEMKWLDMYRWCK